MIRLTSHLRSNTVAYLALFVALGGTSYAAINLPRNSVGARQLRNGSVTTKKLANGAVTPKKLNAGAIGGSILHWANVRQDGKVIGGSRGTRVSVSGPTYYVVDWETSFPTNCGVVVTSTGGGVAGGSSATGFGVQVVKPSRAGGATQIYVVPHDSNPTTGASFVIAVLC